MITKESLQRHDHDNARVIMTIMSMFGIPSTYLDVGSGSGAMVRTARGLGVNAIGLDILAESPDIRHDLTQPINLNRKFDLITSIETAEHLPETAADNIVNIITHHLKPGGLLVFTAALPGQPGDGHYNCQPHTYWREKFYTKGLNYRMDETAYLGLLWQYTAGGLSAWLTPNVQVFRG